MSVGLNKESRPLQGGGGCQQWALIEGITPLATRIRPMKPDEAKWFFLDRYYELCPLHDPLGAGFIMDEKLA